jgi:cell surface protein SprA
MLITSNIDADGYPLGFGKKIKPYYCPLLWLPIPEVMRRGFYGDFRSVPIPNWAVKYNGLMRYDLFKRNFKRFSLQHNYRASYTINQYRSNFDYDKTPDGVDASGNFFNKTIMSNVNLVEQFSPLIRMDFELKVH